MSDAILNKPLPTPETHPMIFRLAREMGAPLSFFDLETTTHIVSSPQFGITEFAFLAVMPDGKAHAHAKLLNPENPISPDAERITGITHAMVDGQPHFGAHAEKVLRMMERSVMIGFNCNSFDTIGLLKELDRYGIARPAAWRSSDLRDIWRHEQNTLRGTQTVVAEHYGVPFEGAHRAFADCSALADILEQMIWRHGVESFHRSMKENWDGPQAKTGADASSKAPRKPAELTPAGVALKNILDQELPKKLSVAEFADALLAQGYRLEITKGGAAYIFGRGGSAPEERVSGGTLGKNYVWNEVRAQLSGEIPASLFGSGPVYGKNSEAPRAPASDMASRQEDAERARAALLDQARTGARVDVPKAVADSGGKASAVSFAISALLAEGSLKLEQVCDPAAQKWLDERWDSLPNADRLTPFLKACQNAGAPPEVDFTQLRVAIATRKARMPAQSAQAPRADIAPRPPAASPAASYSNAFHEEPPPFDDVPPFDAEPPFDAIQRLAP